MMYQSEPSLARCEPAPDTINAFGVVLVAFSATICPLSVHVYADMFLMSICALGQPVGSVTVIGATLLCATM